MITKTALRFLAAIVAANSMSPAFGQTHRPNGDKDVRRHAVPHHERSAPGGYDDFGAAPNTELRLDPNSPEATGGGSQGYNERL